MTKENAIRELLECIGDMREHGDNPGGVEIHALLGILFGDRVSCAIETLSAQEVKP